MKERKKIGMGDLVRLNLPHFFRGELTKLRGEPDFSRFEAVIGLVLSRNEFAMVEVFWMDNLIRGLTWDFGAVRAWHGLMAERFLYRTRTRRGRYCLMDAGDLLLLEAFP